LSPDFEELEYEASDYFLYRSDEDALYELMYPGYFDFYLDNGWLYNTMNMDSIHFYLYNGKFCV
jgi:hypothetical protein